MTDNTPTREQIQQALHAIDDEGSDFVVRPIGWPWNHLIAAARLWLEHPDNQHEGCPPYGSHATGCPDYIPSLGELLGMDRYE